MTDSQTFLFPNTGFLDFSLKPSSLLPLPPTSTPMTMPSFVDPSTSVPPFLSLTPPSPSSVDSDSDHGSLDLSSSHINIDSDLHFDSLFPQHSSVLSASSTPSLSLPPLSFDQPNQPAQQLHNQIHAQLMSMRPMEVANQPHASFQAQAQPQSFVLQQPQQALLPQQPAFVPPSNSLFNPHQPSLAPMSMSMPMSASSLSSATPLPSSVSTSVSHPSSASLNQLNMQMMGGMHNNYNHNHSLPPSHQAQSIQTGGVTMTMAMPMNGSNGNMGMDGNSSSMGMDVNTMGGMLPPHINITNSNNTNTVNHPSAMMGLSGPLPPPPNHGGNMVGMNGNPHPHPHSHHPSSYSVSVSAPLPSIPHLPQLSLPPPPVVSVDISSSSSQKKGSKRSSPSASKSSSESLSFPSSSSAGTTNTNSSNSSSSNNAKKRKRANTVSSPSSPDEAGSNEVSAMMQQAKARIQVDSKAVSSPSSSSSNGSFNLQAYAIAGLPTPTIEQLVAAGRAPAGTNEHTHHVASLAMAHIGAPFPDMSAEDAASKIPDLLTPAQLLARQISHQPSPSSPTDANTNTSAVACGVPGSLLTAASATLAQGVGRKGKQFVNQSVIQHIGEMNPESIAKLLEEQDVVKRRLARKAELARVSRRRKKMRIGDLETENTQLRAELEHVKSQLALIVANFQIQTAVSHANNGNKSGANVVGVSASASVSPPSALASPSSTATSPHSGSEDL